MKANKTFIIRHKETKEIWNSPAGKTSWKAKNHAATAWASMGTDVARDVWGVKLIPTPNSYREFRIPYFREQDIYEIYEITNTNASDFLIEVLIQVRELNKLGKVDEIECLLSSALKENAV